ncbi:MAG: gamma-glutamylcyclotransferase family protein, partial [Acidimicrobiia bacterium]
MSRLYFAYGSNMSETTLRERGIEAERAGIGLLRGYRLAFTLPSRRWTGRAADILATPQTGVWGVVWRIAEATVLDAYEANYDRIVTAVTRYGRSRSDGWAPDGRSEVWTYAVRVARKSATEAPPAPAYAQRMREGAEAARLPRHYLAFLRATTEARSLNG